jgi:hypothetical protein
MIEFIIIVLNIFLYFFARMYDEGMVLIRAWAGWLVDYLLRYCDSFSKLSYLGTFFRFSFLLGGPMLVVLWIFFPIFRYFLRLALFLIVGSGIFEMVVIVVSTVYYIFSYVVWIIILLGYFCIQAIIWDVELKSRSSFWKVLLVEFLRQYIERFKVICERVLVPLLVIPFVLIIGFFVVVLEWVLSKIEKNRDEGDD